MQLVGSLVLFALCGSACRSGPQVTVCVLNSAATSLECSAPDGREYTLPLAEADNYVCFTPRDIQKILNACRSGTAHE